LVRGVKKALLKFAVVRALRYVIAYVGGVNALLATTYSLMLTHAPSVVQEGVKGIEALARVYVALLYNIAGYEVLVFIAPWIASGFITGFIAGSKLRGAISSLLVALIPVAITALLSSGVIAYDVEPFTKLVSQTGNDVIANVSNILTKVVGGGYEVLLTSEYMVKFYIILATLALAGVAGGYLGGLARRYIKYILYVLGVAVAVALGVVVWLLIRV